MIIPIKNSIFALVMKKYSIVYMLVGLMLASVGFSACDDDDTYADQKERERKAISAFLSKGACVLEEDSKDTLINVPPIKVISEETFAEQDSTTNVEENEYVLLSATGIYMQIVRKGSGEKLKHGESTKVLNRFIEFNILGDSIQATNKSLYYVAIPDEMTVSNSYGVFTGSFISGVMLASYNASVPEGWLIPFTYINLGRYSGKDDDIALVRLIVPHTSGTTRAQSTSGVYPCFYEISYQKGR